MLLRGSIGVQWFAVMPHSRKTPSMITDFLWDVCMTVGVRWICWC